LRFSSLPERRDWENGEAIEVITYLFDYFNPANKPPRWPDWLTR
jgi:hypothetical protein